MIEAYIAYICCMLVSSILTSTGWKYCKRANCSAMLRVLKAVAKIDVHNVREVLSCC